VIILYCGSIYKAHILFLLQMLVELSVVKEQGVLDFLIIRFIGVPMQSFCIMGAKHPDQNLQDGAKLAEFGGKFTTKGPWLCGNFVISICTHSGSLQILLELAKAKMAQAQLEGYNTPSPSLESWMVELSKEWFSTNFLVPSYWSPLQWVMGLNKETLSKAWVYPS